MSMEALVNTSEKNLMYRDQEKLRSFTSPRLIFGPVNSNFLQVRIFIHRSKNILGLKLAVTSLVFKIFAKFKKENVELFRTYGPVRADSLLDER